MSDEDLLSNEPLDETTELAALAKAIALGSGYGFKLLFACISHDGHRQRLEQSLISQVAPLKVLRVALAKDVSFVLDDLQTGFEDEHPDALSVSGLEQSIFAHEKPHSAPVLAGLNIGRSSFFTRLPCPLLFWMTPDALALLSRGAPDFFSIRSGVYRFEESVPELSSILFELSLLRNKLNPPLQQLETLLGEVIRHQGQQHSLAGQAFLLLGDCFLRAHRPDLAGRAYHLAQVPFLATESTSGLVHARIGLSLARYRMGDLASARATVETALELARNEGLREEETRALLVLGDVYTGLGEPFKAGDAFESASKLADRLGNKDWVAQAREGLERSGKLVGSERWGVTRGVNVTRILFLTANPSGTAALQLDEEIRLIGQRISRGEYRKLFEIRSAPAIRATDLPFVLMDNTPEVVHFSGHGSSVGELLFVNDSDGKLHPVPAKTLARVFKQVRDRVRCVVLNACYSRIQAEAIAESIPCVVGMSRAVPDATAIAFAGGFYEALAFGKSVADAFELGQTQVELTAPQLMDTADIPQLVVRAGEDASKIFLTGTPPQSPTAPAPRGKPEPATVDATKPPTTLSLRKLLGAVLKTSTDLDAFCIDHFPDVWRHFSAGMARASRESLLLELAEPSEIVAALARHDFGKLEKHIHLLTYR